ncbi:MAG TPA: type IV pilin [Thermoplasmata archaeon]|nr:type IV pilin [Thermoplasmata archaeon]
MQGRGRALRAHRRGLSEIVGALMLVLIVVVAATALAAFIASYQKQLQTEQNLTQQRALENLRAMTILPLDSASTPTQWAALNFTVVSLYVNPSVITSVSVNGNPVRNYTAWSLNLSTGQFQSTIVGAGGELRIGPHEQFNLNVSTVPSAAASSFYDPSVVIHTTDFVKVEIFTALLNDFKQVFIPPSAVPFINLIEAGCGSTGCVTIPVLDGSHCFQVGNASIVSWSWSIYPDGTMASGEEANAAFTAPTGTNHLVNLTVTNSDGLVGFGTLHYKY